jgi:hypothetical protein
MACGALVGLASSPAYSDGGDGGNQVDLRATLTGSAINGIIPEGQAEFKSDGSRREFRTDVQNVNLRDGTVLTVNVNGHALGQIMLSGGQGELELRTDAGQSVPVIRKGAKVTVTKASGAIVEMGVLNQSS